MANENFHEGHRARLLDKLYSNPEILTDHELLEAVLFLVVPRKDTNPMAHKLLRVFGSLRAVFSATAKELMVVEGIGKTVATKICSIGKVYQRINKEKLAGKRISSYDGLVATIISEFLTLTRERCEIFLLNSHFGVLHSLPYENNMYDKVEFKASELAMTMNVHGAKQILIAHNHPSGDCSPSIVDDCTTASICNFCKYLGIPIVDHIIVSSTGYFSYKKSGRLDEIIKNPSYYVMLATGKADL